MLSEITNVHAIVVLNPGAEDGVVHCRAIQAAVTDSQRKVVDRRLRVP